MEEKMMQEDYEIRMEEIHKQRDIYQEQLAVSKKEAKAFEDSFFNDMRELEAIKEQHFDDIRLIDRTEICQNTLHGIKRKIDDMFEEMQKELTGKIKELDDREGYLRYEIAQMKK